MRWIFVILLTLTAVQAQDMLGAVAWQAAVPAGDFRDFISAPTLRGVGVEIRRFLRPDVSVGVAAAWHVFHQVRDEAMPIPHGHVSGPQNRTVNIIPVGVSGHYYRPQGEKAFLVGGRLGAACSIHRHEIGVSGFENRAWHLFLAPEAGVLIKSDRGIALFSVAWNIAVKSDNRQYTFFTFNVGFAGQKP